MHVGDRIARCNTVHSLTAPRTVLERYGLTGDYETGILTCSLQMTRGDVPENVPAQISGTATSLTGKTQRIDFKEVLEREAVTYVGTFSLAERSRIDFSVWLYDPLTGERYHVELRQAALPERLSPAFDPEPDPLAR